VELRAFTAEEIDALARAAAFGFGERHHPERLPDLEALVEPERTVGWRDGGTWVATGGARSYGLAVPGGELPAAGITAITVHPTHRRRGLLRGMMEALLRDAREREEPLAVLWAAEAGIYGRFGFGMGVPHHAYRLDRWFSAFRPDVAVPTGRLAFLPAEGASAPQLLAIAERSRRPGTPRRDENELRHATLAPDPDEEGERRLVLYEDEGYALFLVQGGWDEPRDIPNGTLTVLELAAATPDAEVALWRFLLDVDLMARTVAGHRPVDDALPHLLADPRRLETLVVDGLWVALLDPPAALAGRRYGAEDRLVLEVDGTGYVLEGGPDGASCAPSAASPDVSLSAEALGALYLGGIRPSGLHAAGRLGEGTPGAVARLARMLACPEAPWCPVDF